jgi:ketosteroid isomerase-like protein
MSGPGRASDDERAVAEANASFYEAFEQKSVVAMGEVWAAASPVSCIHPGWAVLVGRDTVLESWRQIFESTVSARCRIRRPRVFVAGDVGWVVLVEELALVQASGERVHAMVLATNTFVRESGRFRMVHHQAGPTPESEIAGGDEAEEPEEPGPTRMLH